VINANIENSNEKEKIYRGAIALFCKKTDQEPLFLVVENTKTGNVSFVGGAKEDFDQSLEECAQREIEEELGLEPGQYKLKSTGVKQEFVFGPQKVDRAGCKGEYHIFLAKMSAEDEIGHTGELKSAKWMTKEEVLQSLSFPDLKEIFEKVIEEM